MVANNYDFIARNYDLISRLVFQKSITYSQRSLAAFVRSPANLLIVGGGTGGILDEISKFQPKGLNITYLDSSTKMIDLAQKRNWEQNQLTFVTMPVENFTSEQKFDVIITPFIFDNFNQKKANLVFNLLSDLLSAEGLWLFSDFKVQTGLNGIWQKALLKLMYWFFWISCRIEAVSLSDLETNFDQANFQMVYRSEHFFRFIQSVVYRRSTAIRSLGN